MFPGERVSRRRMLLHTERRRLPSLNAVAGTTLACILALRKLTFMYVAVASDAFVKWQWLLEIPIGMTRNALGLGVLSQKRELRLGVVKLLALRNFFPAGRGVACLTGLCECGAVRVVVTVAAFRKGHAGESGFSAR